MVYSSSSGLATGVALTLTASPEAEQLAKILVLRRAGTAPELHTFAG
jgi:LuxR family transcriptional regulator